MILRVSKPACTSDVCKKMAKKLAVFRLNEEHLSELVFKTVQHMHPRLRPCMARKHMPHLICTSPPYAQVDIFALGIMCLELLEGRPPGLDYGSFKDLDQIAKARAEVFEDMAK